MKSQSLANARTAALNKKGLRRYEKLDGLGEPFGENRSPEQEGITTRAPDRCSRAPRENRSPEQEGITTTVRAVVAPLSRENRSPEQEGITTSSLLLAIPSRSARTAALNKKGLRQKSFNSLNVARQREPQP